MASLTIFVMGLVVAIFAFSELSDAWQRGPRSAAVAAVEGKVRSSRQGHEQEAAAGCIREFMTSCGHHCEDWQHHRCTQSAHPQFFTCTCSYSAKRVEFLGGLEAGQLSTAGQLDDDGKLSLDSRDVRQVCNQLVDSRCQVLCSSHRFPFHKCIQQGQAPVSGFTYCYCAKYPN